jgi:hypothetical protein
MLAGEVNFVNDSFGVMLLDGSHIPDEALENRRDIDGEVSAPGYTQGGQTAHVKVFTTEDGETEIVLGGAAWPTSTITARYAVYYRKSGMPARDALVALVDFGADIRSINDLFSLTDSEIAILTN